MRIGNEVATIAIGGTPQQIGAALERFATSLGISLEGTPTEDMTRILEYVKDDIKRRSKQVQAAEKRVVSEATIQQEVEADNPL